MNIILGSQIFFQRLSILDKILCPIQDSNLWPFRYERTATDRTELIGRIRGSVKADLHPYLYFQVVFIRRKHALQAKPILCRYKLLKPSLLHPNFYSRNWPPVIGVSNRLCSVAWTRTTPPAYETGMQPLHFNAIYKRSMRESNPRLWRDRPVLLPLHK